MKTMTLMARPISLPRGGLSSNQLDVAPKTVELTVYFVVGGDS